MKLTYACIGTGDKDRALEFYDSFFEGTGVGKVFDTDRGRMYGTPPFNIIAYVCTPFDGKQATASNGGMLALNVDDTKQVDELHAKAISLGAKDEGAPGRRGGDDSPAYFGYFRDLDGNKIGVYNYAS